MSSDKYATHSPVSWMIHLHFLQPNDDQNKLKQGLNERFLSFFSCEDQAGQKKEKEKMDVTCGNTGGIVKTPKEKNKDCMTSSFILKYKQPSQSIVKNLIDCYVHLYVLFQDTKATISKAKNEEKDCKCPCCDSEVSKIE